MEPRTKQREMETLMAYMYVNCTCRRVSNVT